MQKLIRGLISLIRDVDGKPATNYPHRDLPGRPSDSVPPPFYGHHGTGTSQVAGNNDLSVADGSTQALVVSSPDSETTSDQSEPARSRKLFRSRHNRVQPFTDVAADDRHKQEPKRDDKRRRRPHEQQQTFLDDNNSTELSTDAVTSPHAT